MAGIIEKSLFFFGAGFSKYAGCLTSVQMFEDLKKKIFDDVMQYSVASTERCTEISNFVPEISFGMAYYGNREQI